MYYICLSGDGQAVFTSGLAARWKDHDMMQQGRLTQLKRILPISQYISLETVPLSGHVHRHFGYVPELHGIILCELNIVLYPLCQLLSP